MSLHEQDTISVRDSKAVAQHWAINEAASLPGFVGAFLAGSTTSLADDARVEPTSDVDVKVILDTDDLPDGPQKVPWRDVVLDVSYAPLDEVGSAEVILANYYTAGHLARDSILLDPTGHLQAIQPTIAREYARRDWVRRRCDHARSFAAAVLSEPATAPSGIHHRMIKWLLSICAMTHLVLVADLCNPTIRKCLVAFKDTLSTYDHQSMHERVLDLFGTREVQQGEVEALLASCIEAFDAARKVITTPFFCSSNISEHGRPIAIDGSRVLIDGGHHREAVFWIAVIHTWCQTALQNDAPADIQTRFTPGYERMLDALGLRSSNDLEVRFEQTRALLPDVWRVAEEIIERNPRIVA